MCFFWLIFYFLWAFMFVVSCVFNFMSVMCSPILIKRLKINKIDFTWSHQKCQILLISWVLMYLIYVNVSWKSIVFWKSIMIDVSWKSITTLMSSMCLAFMVYVSYVLCLCIMHVFVLCFSLQFVGNFSQCVSKAEWKME
jgi:hypothetical protein